MLHQMKFLATRQISATINSDLGEHITVTHQKQ